MRILALFLLCSCCKLDDGYTRFVTKKGDHRSTPTCLKIKTDAELSGSVYFTEGSKYELDTANQKNWNKVTGFRLDLNKVPKASAMVVWKYNNRTSLFDVAPYFNKDGIVFPSQSNVISVNTYDLVFFDISCDKVSCFVHVWSGSQEGFGTVELDKGLLVKQVHPWFGGSAVAPNDVEIFLKIN
jgi:hypothetical protein